jgi:hypothetical protein
MRRVMLKCFQITLRTWGLAAAFAYWREGNFSNWFAKHSVTSKT